MKKKILLFCIFLLTIAPALQAQDSLLVTPRATMPYKFAFGLRYSPAGPGSDYSFTAKYFLSNQSALEAQASKLTFSDNYMATLSYIWQPQLLTSTNIRPYAGLGIGVLHYQDHHPEGRITKTSPVAVVTAGIEYTFSKVPIAISLDYRAPILRYDNSNTSPRLPLSTFSNFGLGIKFLLK